MKVDRNNKLSKQLASKINAQPKQCWTNAVYALMEIGEGLYVEGWAVPVDVNVPIEHGWLEVNGKIVDPTPAMLRSEASYFSGKRYDLHAVYAAMNSGCSFPLVWASGWGGFADPQYKAAHDVAYDYALREGRLI